MHDSRWEPTFALRASADRQSPDRERMAQGLDRRGDAIGSFLLFWTLLTWTCFFTSAGAHGLHISFGKSVLTERVFTGKVVFNKLDFQDALSRWNDRTPLMDLASDERSGLILRYFKRHLKASANGQRDLKLEIVEQGAGAQTIWFRFRFESKEPIDWLRVEHRALFAAFPDQGNVLEVKSGEKTMNHLFRPTAPAYRFDRATDGRRQTTDDR